MAEAEMTDAPPKELASNLTLNILQIVKVSHTAFVTATTRGTDSTARAVSPEFTRC